ncbi:MAG: porin [Gammaproteobacteria bacterium]
MKTFKKIALAAACTAMLGGVTMQAQAANWLMLQGTESPGEGARARVWGFLQPTYLTVDGTKLPAAGWAGQNAQFNVHQPDLSSESTFQMMRARVGIRGTALPLDSNVNYFIMAEYGNNGITQPGGGSGSVKLADATVTLNHIDGMRIRLGQMKIPMSEELYQGIMTWNYINMTNIGNMQLIERPFWTDGNTPCLATSQDAYKQYCYGDAQTQFRSGANAVRDQGIQLFDTFKSDTWEHSYAILYGNGGVNKDNRDGEFDTTVYWSSEKVFGGKGPWRDHMKFYLWNTDGKRTLYDSALLNTAGTSQQEAEKVYDRKLSGVGFTYQRNKYRVWGEYIKAEGMIFNGSTGGAVPGALNNAGTEVSQFLLTPTGESDGGYIDFGYKVTPKLELDIRYDWYNRVTNLAAAAERKFETTTLGMQYWFNRKSKLLLNYEIRSMEAPALAATHAANQIADSIDDKISAQVFVLF